MSGVLKTHQNVAIVQKSKTVVAGELVIPGVMCLMVDLSTQILYW